jgi:hypothetical protein
MPLICSFSHVVATILLGAPSRQSSSLGTQRALTPSFPPLDLTFTSARRRHQQRQHAAIDRIGSAVRHHHVFDDSATTSLPKSPS